MRVSYSEAFAESYERWAASSPWWATNNQWLGLVDVARLEVEALYGWFDRRPFDDSSREFVWIAHKPA